jgi:hypothetical protein
VTTTACFFDNRLGIRQSTEYLERFFDNLLNGAQHELCNEDLSLAGQITRQGG